MDYCWRLVASVLGFVVFFWGFGLVISIHRNHGNPAPYFRWTGRLAARTIEGFVHLALGLISWVIGQVWNFFRWLIPHLWQVIVWLFHGAIHNPLPVLFAILGIFAGVAIGYYLWYP
ncbi:MAG: hypothetical protein HYT37_03210 [Candidatus Sungbacteria bacterium]|nr:hypothetical protein [Candidatus Sungbacteria bacterium]